MSYVVHVDKVCIKVISLLNEEGVIGVKPQKDKMSEENTEEQM
jgi:hypothetical protein